MKILGIFFVFLILEQILGQQSTWPEDTYQKDVCVCVPVGHCLVASGSGNSDGRGSLDPRISTSGGMPAIITGTINSTCKPASIGVQISAMNQSDCGSPDLELCCPSIGYTCGVRYPPVNSASRPTSGSGQAEYGSHPWLIAIFDLTNIYVGTGVLISHLHALTAAHKVFNQTWPLTVRLGEYDMSGAKLPFPRVDINATFVMHPNFTLSNLKNNIAVLTLLTPAPLGRYPSIGNLCIPNVTLSGIRCWVAGWGQDFFVGGNMQNKMREIDVPLIDFEACQFMLRNNTVLGKFFGLDRRSFVCAGAEAGKDACTGDGGSPLTCFVYDRYYLMGLAAWGMGCGQAGVPGVYVNVQTYMGWIQSTIQNIQKRVNTTTVRPSTQPGAKIGADLGAAATLKTARTKKSRTTKSNVTPPKGAKSVGATTTTKVTQKQ